MHKSHFCSCVLCAALGLALLLAVVLLSAQPAIAQAAGKGELSFINDVAPILKENCFACHDAKKRKGKFDMTTYENFRKGGDKEDPIVAGKPDESPIVDRLTAKDNSRMPPKEAGEPLPKEKIAVIEKWIAQGAKFDAGLNPKADLVRELRVRWKPPAPPLHYRFPVTITALAFTPDNKQLVIGGQHELTVWDLQGKLQKRVSTRAERAYGMAFLPDGKLVVAGGRPGQEGDLRIYDLQGGKPKMEHDVALLDGVNDPGVMIKQLLDADDTILCVAVRPDGKKLACGGSNDRLVNVWDLTPGYANAKLEQTIENHADWVLGLAFSPDGKHLLTCSRDKTAKVWDLTTKESVLTFPDHQNPVYGVAIKPDGKIAFSVGEDNQIRSWNATGEGKQIRALGGHSRPIFRVIHHPKLPLLLTSSADNTVRIWNADKGQAVRTLGGHTDWVYALALSPDGSLAASGTWNGEVRIWKIPDGKLVKSFNASPGLQQTAKSSQ